MDVATAAEPQLRADALRNRARIVAAAREMLVEQGANVPFDEIARRAGVGNATIYRHFADRAELFQHVLLSVTERLSEQAEAARREEADAFQALERFVHAAVEERIGALCPLLSNSIDKEDRDLLAARARFNDGVVALMEDAQASGQLRLDIHLGDLMVALIQLTRPLPGSGCTHFESFVHRHLQLFLDGLVTPARSTLPGSAATLEALRQQ